MLKRTIALIPEVFICIDALDESSPKNRLELLRSLGDIVRDLPTVRVFLTGRPHVQDEIDKHFAGAVKLPISPTTEDIKAYLKMRLDGDTEVDAMDDELRADIMEKIPERISEVFLLVSLNIETILGEITIYHRRKMLEEMTRGNGLGDAYTATMARMKGQNVTKSKIGMEVLMWVSHSKRPLQAAELCQALGVEIGSTDLNPQRIPSIKTLLGCCLGLVAVEGSPSIVRLVHFSLKEYLSQHPALFHSPHAMIAEVCLTYLNFQSIRQLPLNSPWVPQPPFLEYASYYWAPHFKREFSENAKPLALRLLNIYHKHISSKLLLEPQCNLPKISSFPPLPYYRYLTGPLRFSALHFTAYLGLSELMVDLLAMKKWDLNALDSEGNTAIMWAAKQGHETVVRILLEQENVNPDTVDNDGQTMLWHASYRGRVNLVKALLERGDLNLNIADKNGQTPLWWAARQGYFDVVKVLLGRSDIKPEIADKNGRTSLSSASERGHEGICKLLLERNDVNPDMADKYGRTPLLWAASKGRVGVVKMLLRREEVNPYTYDLNGKTPYLWALENNHSAVAKLPEDRMNSIKKSADGLESPELSSTESSELPQRPSKRIRIS